MKRRTVLAAALAIALVVPALPAGASSATLVRETLVVNKPLTGAYRELAYAPGSVIYSNWLAEDDGSPVDLYRYATSTAKSTRVVKTDGGDSSVEHPRISGSRLVYTRIKPVSGRAEYDIYLRDFTSSTVGKEARLTSNPAQQEDPDISGNRVVWQDDRNGNWDIYMATLTSAGWKESVVCTATGDQTAPSISGTKVVYADNRASSSNWDIFVTDVATGKERRLSTSSGNQSNAVISGSDVVYEDATGVTTSIRHLKLGTDAAGKITASPSRGLSLGTANQYAPDVSGGRVVWVSDNGQTSALYLYHLAYGTRHKLVSGTALISSPQISGSKVGYIKNDNRIYLATLRTPKITLAAPTKVKKGARATITGKFRTSAGSAISKRTLYVEQSLDKKKWTRVATLKTSRTGGYSYKTGAIKKETYVRVTYKGGSTYLSARSRSAKIGVK